jgi:hypothetical protein
MDLGIPWGTYVLHNEIHTSKKMHQFSFTKISQLGNSGCEFWDPKEMCEYSKLQLDKVCDTHNYRVIVHSYNWPFKGEGILSYPVTVIMCRALDLE